MMETYTTVTKEIKNPWDCHGRRKSTSQPSFHEDRGENTVSFGFRETFGRERTPEEADSSELTTKSLCPSLDPHEKQGAIPSSSLKQDRERQPCQSERPDGEKIRQGAWQQLFFQGWKILFNPPPQQRGEPVMKQKDVSFGEVPKKHEEVLELRHHQLDHPSQAFSRGLRQADGEKERQSISGMDGAGMGQQKKCADEIFEKNYEARKVGGFSCEISQEGTGDTKRSHDSQEDTDIKLKAQLREYPGSWETSSEDSEKEKIEKVQAKRERREDDRAADCMRKIFQSSLDPEKTPESERKGCEAYLSQLMRRPLGSPLFLKGWSLLFYQAPQQREQPIMGFG